MMNYPQGFVEMLQTIGDPICRAIARTDGSCAIMNTDRPQSFLSMVAQCCSVGASDRVSVLAADDSHEAPEYGEVDGLAFPDVDALLIPGSAKSASRNVTTLDRKGLLLPRVAAVILGIEAVRSKAWRGAKGLIARDRPVFVAYAGGDGAILDELQASDYVVRPIDHWCHPRAMAMLVLAVPAELAAAPVTRLITIAPPLLTRSLRTEKTYAGVPQISTLFDASRIEAASGLYPVESADKHTWVWTGPAKRTDIVLPQLWVGPHTLRLKIIKTFATEGLAGLTFFINGRIAESTIFGDSIELFTMLPPSEFTGTIELGVFTPQLSDSTVDRTRHLGTCIEHLQIFWS